MKTMHHSWQRSVAALALAVAFNPTPEASIAQEPPSLPSNAAAVEEGKAADDALFSSAQAPSKNEVGKTKDKKSPQATNDAVPATADKAPKAHGVILGLEYSTASSWPLVEISIGSDDGLRQGQKLEVFRLNPPGVVGTIEITEVTPSSAKGRLISLRQADGLRKGYLVAERSDELMKILDAPGLQTKKSSDLWTLVEQLGKLEEGKTQKSALPDLLVAGKEIALGQLVIAQEEMRRAQERLAFSERLVQKGYAPADQLIADRIAGAYAEMVAKTAEQQALALGLFEASQKSSDELRSLRKKQEKQIAEDPTVPTMEKLKAIADELEQAKAKLIESFEAQIASVRKAIEESKSQSGGSEEGPKSTPPPGTGQGTAPATKKSGSSTSGVPGGTATGRDFDLGAHSGSRGLPPQLAAERPAQRIRVFQLKECEPESVRQVLEALLGTSESRAGMIGSMWGAGGRAMAGGMSSGVGMATSAGRDADAGFLKSASGPLRIAVDNRTKSLIVRGSEQQLKLVADIIAAFESPGEKLSSLAKNVRVFRLRFAISKGVAELLNCLGLVSRIAEDEKTNAVIVSGPEEEMEEIGELIKALDVEDQPASPNGAASGRVLRPISMPPNSAHGSAESGVWPAMIANPNLEIRLTSDGRLTVNGKAVEQSKLAEQLAEIRKRKTIKGGLGPGKDYFSPPPLSLQVDEQLPYEQLQSLMSTLAKEGFVKVTFQGNKPADAVK